MSDFVSGFWNIYITAISLISILFCVLLLWSQSTHKSTGGVQTTGHVWDEDLEEYSNPMPNWWRWLFYLTVIYSLAYLAVYPGLGSYKGSFGWTSVNEYEAEQKQAEHDYGPIFEKYRAMDIHAVAASTEGKEMGQRLFMTYCAQCHGSDARGANGFPNLTDKDWLWGGTAAQIKESVALGRDAMMPAKGLKPDLNGEQITDLANHVRSLSGLANDATRAKRGKELFTTACAACHGPEGKGTVGLAPNLSDGSWLYSSAESSIVETISKGRSNRMPAFGEFLGEAKVHLLTAYVVSLGGSMADNSVSPAPTDTAAAPSAATAEAAAENNLADL